MGRHHAKHGVGSGPRPVWLVVCMIAFLSTGCRSKDKLPATGSQTFAAYSSAFYTGLAGLEVGDDVRANTGLAEAVSLVPGEPAGWIDWGILALRQRDFDAAANRLQRAHSLVPQDDRVDFLLGLLEAARGDSAAAIHAYQGAITSNPQNLRALYKLAGEVERQGAPGSDATVQMLLQQLLKAEPHNLAALVDLCRMAAKRGDTATLHSTIEALSLRSQSWTPEALQQLEQLRTAASSAAPRTAALRSTFLKNVLMRQADFRDSVAEIAAQPGEEAEPVDRFLRLENVPSQPSPPDEGMTFTPESIPGLPGKWTWAGAIALNGEDAPILAVANNITLRLANGAELKMPEGSAATTTPENVLPFDYNYDFKTDLLLTGATGLRLYRQDSPSKFTEVTSTMKLPPAITTAAYTGAWAVDVEADGDLDVVLGTAHGLPSVLRNNGDGTFTVIHPFAGISGIRQFVWADLNGDGNPDAALIDGTGRLHIFLNQRLGIFEEVRLPEPQDDARAITIADTGGDGFLRVQALRQSGIVAAYSWQQKTGHWSAETIAQLPPLPRGEVRMHAADIDNNGAVDLIVTQVSADSNGKAGALLVLQDASGSFHSMAQAAGSATVFALADLHNDGRIGLIGLDAAGQPVAARNQGTKNYHWQSIRPRARQATGDQRINPFGIGGEIEIRSGLLVQKQPISGPILHFGLGIRDSVDVARITWPNGTIRAEFNLKANQQIVTEQRLKGSCPFLFAWNGTRMDFVKDSVPWGSAIGLRINSLGTARIAATEEWYKINGNQLVPQNGFYDVRITGELWESYFYDSLALMTVDHPIGSEVYTDERFDVPAVKLAVTPTAEPHPVQKAVDDLGNDVTDTVRKVDGRYLDTFGRGQYQGITRDHYIEVDLGDQLPAGKPLWLIANGWLHPSDSTVNVAMAQGTHAAPRWLSLEVPDGRGGWRVAKSNLGFPAGRNKTCLIDLTGIFPRGIPHRLRLRTNLEIYWDSIQWAEGKPSTEMKIQRLLPATADLHYRGFSSISQVNMSSPEIPSYQHLAGSSPRWRDLSGFYTRFGDVKELLASIDDRYVIMNAGDELSLRFAVPPPPPPGWTRDYVIAGDGWIKDGDFNSTESRTVMPYPHHARKSYDTPPTSLEDDWEYRHHRDDWFQYQTRYVDSERFQDGLRSSPAGNQQEKAMP